MGQHNQIRGEDNEILDKYWQVTKDANGNDMIIGNIKVIHNPHQERENDLPIESNSSDAYFKADVQKRVIQLRVYDEHTHKAIMDIDFIDGHRNKKTGEVFPAGVAHVQEFKMKNGVPVRDSKNARLMTEEEIAKWGDVIRLANPNVKFRP